MEEAISSTTMVTLVSDNMSGLWAYVGWFVSLSIFIAIIEISYKTVKWTINGGREVAVDKKDEVEGGIMYYVDEKEIDFEPSPFNWAE